MARPPRPTRGVLVGAVLMTGLAFPLVVTAGLGLLDGLGVPPGLLATALFALVFGLAYAATSVVTRDAGRFLDRAEAVREAHHARARRPARAALPFAVDDATFDRLVGEELDALPPWVRSRLEDANLHVEVHDQDDEAPFVLGTFSSLPAGDGSNPLLVITLYRLPLVRAARVPAALRQQVRATLLHEVGHFFGMAEDDLDRYEIGNDPVPDASPVRPLRDGWVAGIRP